MLWVHTCRAKSFQSQCFGLAAVVVSLNSPLQSMLGIYRAQCLHIHLPLHDRAGPLAGVIKLSNHANVIHYHYAILLLELYNNVIIGYVIIMVR